MLNGDYVEWMLIRLKSSGTNIVKEYQKYSLYTHDSRGVDKWLEGLNVFSSARWRSLWITVCKILGLDIFQFLPDVF